MGFGRTKNLQRGVELRCIEGQTQPVVSGLIDRGKVKPFGLGGASG